MEDAPYQVVLPEANVPKDIHIMNSIRNQYHYVKLFDNVRILIKRMDSGALDGFVGDDLMTSGGSTVWKVIKNGVPAMFKQGPGSRFFNGKENEHIEGGIPCRNGLPTSRSWSS